MILGIVALIVLDKDAIKQNIICNILCYGDTFSIFNNHL